MKTRKPEQKFTDPICKECGTTQPRSTHEASRDFVFADLYVKCAKEATV